MANLIQEKETRERLLRNVKKECKQLMEVAVTKKFINEDNGCITSLCATIESCLLHGVKRSAMGLFKSNTTMTLIQKISKSCDEAKLILQMCDDYDKAYCSNGAYQNGTAHNMIQPRQQQQLQQSNKKLAGSDNSLVPPLMNGRSFSPTYYKGSSCYKLLWIRLALLNKCLIKIIEYLISNSSKYYAEYAIMADPVDGPIFASLLIGPCALEYTRMKSCDLLWSDPNADELIQRHKMHSSGQLGSTPLVANLLQSGVGGQSTGDHRLSGAPQTNAGASSNSKVIGLNGSAIAKRKASINATQFDESNIYMSSHGLVGSISPRDRENMPQPSPAPLTPSFLANAVAQPPPPSTNQNSAKEYVESLHQNSKSQLIYGKNHVIVSQKDTQFPGYLSLHSTSHGLVLKWTPNQLMSFSSSTDPFPPQKPKSGGGYWDYALNIEINTIVYLHCHQSASSSSPTDRRNSSISSSRTVTPPTTLTGSSPGGASIVLVGQDGIQHPPIRFPKGSHLLQFLTCLETGLGPDGALDPPLRTEFGKGKVFPRLQRRSIKSRESIFQPQTPILEDKENTFQDETKSNNSSSSATITSIPSAANIEPIDEEQEGDFIFRIINSRSNVMVTSVSKDQPKKLEFSISLQSNSEVEQLRAIDPSSSSNLIDSIFPKKKPKLNSFFSWHSSSSNSACSSPKTTTKSRNYASISRKSIRNKSLEPKIDESTAADETAASQSISPKLARTNNQSVDAADTISVKSAPVILSSTNSPTTQSPSPFFKPSMTANDVNNGSFDASLVYSKPDAYQGFNEPVETYSPSIIRSSLKTLCEDMRRQILSRAFYGWLAYHRQIKTINLHLIGLINCERNVIEEEEEDDDEEEDEEEPTNAQHQHNIEQDLEMIERLLNINLSSSNTNGNEASNIDGISQKSLNKICEWYLANKKKLDAKLWSRLSAEKNGKTSIVKNKQYFYRIVYFNGIEQKIRKEVWPFLLEHYTINMNKEDRALKDKNNQETYARLMEEWRPFEDHMKNREIKQSSESSSTLIAYAKTPTNSPSPTATIRGAAHPNISPPAFIKPPISNNTNNAINTSVDAVDTKASTANNTHSFFSFSLLKTSKPLIRKDSSLSNEVFVSEDKPDTSSSFISKFLARNIFAKLMQKNFDHSTTIDEDNDPKVAIEKEAATVVATDELEENKTLSPILEPLGIRTENEVGDDEITDIAREIVSAVITRVVEDLNATEATRLKLSKVSSNLSNYDDACESMSHVTSYGSTGFNMLKSSSSANSSSKNLRSDTRTSSADEIYHDIETEYSNDTFNDLIERAESNNKKESDSVKKVHVSPPEVTTTMITIGGPASGDARSKRKSLSDQDLVDSFGLQMHRIDKDVTRCDRNYSYFVSNENLKKLKNIMYTYVWENLNIGYIQGMCDLVAPLLVIFDNEPMAYSCFKQLMKRMSSNFPHGTAMDQHFANMRTLIQIVDSDLFEHMHHRGDYTHFYFSYRWFLLDFKRELVYDDTFSVWETIWAAKYVCSAHFHLFIALALVETYRDIIIENNMDFTDIIKFFNEMAEKHNTTQILDLARNLIQQIQNLIESKNDNR